MASSKRLMSRPGRVQHSRDVAEPSSSDQIAPNSQPMLSPTFSSSWGAASFTVSASASTTVIACWAAR